jgi:uncharacterized membrane protein YGL010W
MSPVLRNYFDEYARFHATPGNQACHYFAIPLIVLSILAMLAQVHVALVGGVSLTAAELTVIVVTLYYLTLDPILAVMMLAVFGVMAFLGRPLGLWGGVALFVFGWIVQFVGHYVYEKKSPAFYRNLVHLLVGPLWVLAKATGRAR